MANQKGWSYKAGEKGRNRVRAYEDSSSGTILLEYYEHGKRRRISSGHDDREKAKQQADTLAAEFGSGLRQEVRPIVLSKLFDMYLREVTPGTSRRTQKHQHRCAKMFLRLWGRNRKVGTLNRRDWDAFIRQRKTGEMDARGHRVPHADRKPVGNRTVERDLAWLRAVLRWATLAGDGGGGYLLDQNPLRGLTPPKEPSPNRPMLTQDRYKAMLGVASEVGWRFELAFVLAHETGHRIGAIRRLRWSDIDLEASEIRWRAEADKVAHEHVTPLTPVAQEALQAARQRQQTIGHAWVFPAVEESSQPCPREFMYDRFLEAEERAGLEHVKGLGWHGLRRKFATETKHHPVKDVAAVGGWKTEQTLLTCYQQPDRETMRSVVEQRMAVRQEGSADPNRQYEPTVEGTAKQQAVG